MSSARRRTAIEARGRTPAEARRRASRPRWPPWSRCADAERPIRDGRPCRPAARPGGRGRRAGRGGRHADGDGSRPEPRWLRGEPTGAPATDRASPRGPIAGPAGARTSTPMPTIRANGLDIGYDVDGAGPPLVLLHGATLAGRRGFRRAGPAPRRAFRVYVPDARGHGATRWDAADGFRYDWLVEDLRAFVDGLGLATFHLLGFSMGAMTALQFAAAGRTGSGRWSSSGSRPQREPRASVARRLMDPERIEREDPGWARALARAARPGQGEGAWRRLLPAIAADVADPAAAHAGATCAGSSCRRSSLSATAIRSCPSTTPGARPAAARRPPVRRARLRTRGARRRPGLFNEALAGFYRSTTEADRARRRAANAHRRRSR